MVRSNTLKKAELISDKKTLFDSFHSLPHQGANALFAAYRADDLWCFDREYIVLYLKKRC